MEGEAERWLGVCENDRGVNVTEFELKPSVVTIVGKRKHRVTGGMEIP